MPYIDHAQRKAVVARTVGELCFALDSVETGSLADRAGMTAYAVFIILRSLVGSQPRFYKFALAVGVAVCAVLELYRRVVAPYEDQKCAENGDVLS